MAENRDFLAESNQLRAEADEIRKTLVSKTTPNGLLEEIAREMRMIRREVKENQEKNEKKLEEFKVEMKMDILGEIQMLSEQQNGVLDELKKNQQLQNEKMDKLSKQLAKCVPKIPIREAILGEWKMVDHGNYERYGEVYGNTLEEFSENVKYEMKDGKLKEFNAEYNNFVEGEDLQGEKDLYEEDNHLKTLWKEDEAIEPSRKSQTLFGSVQKTTQNGLLEEIARELRMIRMEMKEMKEENKQKLEELKVEVKMEIQEEMRKNQQLQDQKMDKISEELAKCVPKSPIREAILGEWKMVDHENFEGCEELFVTTFEEFSANVKYEMEDGKLKEFEAGCDILVEGGGDDGNKDLYEKDNHLKTFWGRGETVDRYIEDGKLYIFQISEGMVWHRVFVKI